MSKDGIPYLSINKTPLTLEETENTHLDDLATLLEIWERNRRVGRTPGMIKRAIIGIINSESEPTKEENVSSKYEELLLHVVNKIPGETRHQTALRIIRQHEELQNDSKVSASS